MADLHGRLQALFPDACERGKIWAAVLSKNDQDRPLYFLGDDDGVRSTLQSLLLSSTAEVESRKRQRLDEKRERENKSIDSLRIKVAAMENHLRNLLVASSTANSQHDVGMMIMKSSMWCTTLSEGSLDNYLGEPVVNVDSLIQKVLSELNNSGWDTLAARGLIEYNAIAATKGWKYLSAEEFNGRHKERYVQVALWYLCLLVKKLCPEVQWYAIDTSVSGILGVNMKPDLSLCLVPVACVAELLSCLEFKEKHNTTNYASAIGQLRNQADVLFSNQPGRSKAIMAYATYEVLDLMFIERMTMEVRHSGVFSLSFDENSVGLRLLMRLLLTRSSNLGFVSVASPVIPPTSMGAAIENLVLVSIPKRQQADEDSELETRHPSPWDTKVYLCQRVHQGIRVDAVLKLGRVEKEIENLQRVQHIPGVIKLIDNGHCPDGDFFITSPQGDRLSLQMKAADILAAISQIATTIEAVYSNCKLVHRDISIGNIIWVKEAKRAYLIDWATAAEEEMMPEGDVIIGTLVFMSIHVLAKEKRNVSTDLESLMYVLLYIAANAHLPWRRNLVGNNWYTTHRALKFTTMKLDFEKLAKHLTHDLDLKRAAENLRELFFVPDYRTEVTAKEFVEALNKTD